MKIRITGGTLSSRDASNSGGAAPACIFNPKIEKPGKTGGEAVPKDANAALEGTEPEETL